MESNDSYPVFHTRLAQTYRRRLTRPDGWLILTTDQLTTVPADAIEFSDVTDEPERRDDPPQAAIPRQR